MSNYRHGMTGTRTHNTWMRMLDRCKNDRQGTYGRKGIKVCARWHSFEAFLADMGEHPGSDYSIDRRNNKGDYNPGNCRWATRKQQARNTSRNTVLEHDGKAMTIAEWAELTGIKPSTICKRIYDYGWSINKALTQSTLQRLPVIKPWIAANMSRSSWYRAVRQIR